jgi:hypothetical protein
VASTKCIIRSSQNDAEARESLLQLNKEQRVVVTATLGEKVEHFISSVRILFDATPAPRQGESSGTCLVMCLLGVAGLTSVVWWLV